MLYRWNPPKECWSKASSSALYWATSASEETSRGRMATVMQEVDHAPSVRVDRFSGTAPCPRAGPRSCRGDDAERGARRDGQRLAAQLLNILSSPHLLYPQNNCSPWIAPWPRPLTPLLAPPPRPRAPAALLRSEEHTSELQSRGHTE